MTNQLTAEFHGNNLTIINHEGQQWLTAEDVGKALGYNDPLKGINNLYNRHQEEFTESDTATLKLRVNPQGGNPTHRLFSRTGCILLGMFSSTPVAKEFRVWAKRVLAKTPNANEDEHKAERIKLQEQVNSYSIRYQLASTRLKRLEAVWFNRYPDWQNIKTAFLTFTDKTCGQIESQRNWRKGRIRATLQSLLRVGLITPAEVAECDGKRTQLRLEQKFGEVQNG